MPVVSPVGSVLLWAFALFLLWAFVSGVSGHGRLLDPASRASMWRLGFPTPPNYNDNELYCGGFMVSVVGIQTFSKLFFFHFENNTFLIETIYFLIELHGHWNVFFILWDWNSSQTSSRSFMINVSELGPMSKYSTIFFLFFGKNFTNLFFSRFLTFYPFWKRYIFWSKIFKLRNFSNSEVQNSFLNSWISIFLTNVHFRSAKHFLFRATAHNFHQFWRKKNCVENKKIYFGQKYINFIILRNFSIKNCISLNVVVRWQQDKNEYISQHGYADPPSLPPPLKWPSRHKRFVMC